MKNDKRDNFAGKNPGDEVDFRGQNFSKI